MNILYIILTCTYSGGGDGGGVRVGEGTALVVVVVEMTAGECSPPTTAVVVTLGSTEIPDGLLASTSKYGKYKLWS